MNLRSRWHVFISVNTSSDVLQGRVVDEFLVMRCQTGDRDALSALITKWQPPFLRYASIMTRNPDTAKDIIQDAWIKIIRALPKLRDPLKFPAWAFRIINNQCLDALRGTRTYDDLSDIVDNRSMRQLEAQEQVWWVLEQLSPAHRAVLALHYLQGFEVQDIAEILRKPQGTIKSRLYHGREKFKAIFEAQDTKHERSRREDTTSLAGSH